MIEGLVKIAGSLLIGGIGLLIIVISTLLLAVLISELKNRYFD